MSEFMKGTAKPKMRGNGYAWAALGAGAILVAYSLLRPADAGIPGWQPVNPSVRATLAAHASSATSIGPTRPAKQSAAAASSSPAAAIAAPSASAAHSAAKPAQAAHADQLDLNSATQSELDGLPGIGAAKAKAVIAYRTAHKGFRKVDELQQVKGIGPKLFDRIRPLVTVQSR